METHEPYLISLNRRLAEAASGWAEDLKRPFGRFTLDRYRAGEGFVGRAGGGDVYYTAFALRTLTMLGQDIEPIRDELIATVAGRIPAGLPDLVSGLFVLRMLSGNADLPDAATVAAAFEQLHCDDGGYAKAPGGVSSTYGTFLVSLGYDLLGGTPPAPEAIGSFIATRQRDDGGFAELDRMPHSSINPTAAAAAVAMATGVLDGDAYDGVCRFLLGTQGEDGGWPASSRVPLSDLLSTFTAALTLCDLGVMDQANAPAMEQFVRGCRVESAGFGGAANDNVADVEYTFYGLGSLAVLGVHP